MPEEICLYLTVDVTSANAAFQDGNARAEAVRILRQAVEKIEAGAEGDFDVYDVNGNKIGVFTYLEQDQGEDDS